MFRFRRRPVPQEHWIDFGKDVISLDDTDDPTAVLLQLTMVCEGPVSVNFDTRRGVWVVSLDGETWSAATQMRALQLAVVDVLSRQTNDEEKKEKEE